MDTQELIARADASYLEYDETGRGLANVAALVPDLIATLRAEREARERAEAMVAAAYLDAADVAFSCSSSNNYFVSAACAEAAKTILTRTPADAQAALDRVKQHAADEALERAARVADKKSVITEDEHYWGYSAETLAQKALARGIAFDIRAMKGSA